MDTPGNSTTTPHGDAEDRPSGAILGYLACPQDAASGFLGALLITDARARPLHFAYVSPIRPTAMQRLLYGATLIEHVKIDVIAKTLMQGAAVVPTVLFVDAPDLVAVRRVVGLPTAFLVKNTEAQSGSSNISTLKYDTGANSEDQEIIGQVLAELEPWIDLVEPFTRLREAMKEALKAPPKA
ncbi:MAG TPA: hypothetical protein VNA25_29085 [Phycisphaerae bacterium]|nr:hypothetical protein [Phycisphaerae bacterium]